MIFGYAMQSTKCFFFIQLPVVVKEISYFGGI